MMRRRALDLVCASCRHCSRIKTVVPREQARRSLHISTTPSSTEPGNQEQDASTPAADARFEVLGSPYSLLSASIAASQNLYIRKGSLVGFNGNPENAVSTLSMLEPFRRAIAGVPFLYQRVSSTTPYTALIATKSPVTSLAIVHIDGRLDWMIAQRNALLAWTGHTMSLSPRLNTKLGLAHFGSTSVTGRGLLALSGKGLIYQLHLKSGEDYVVHPSNIVAYSVMQHAPQPYRFKANLLRFQIPNPIAWFPDTRLWRIVRESTAWKMLRDATFVVRTWTRRLIWGDRLFLHFRGPVTILLQSRGASISESLTSRDINEIADSPAGAVQSALAPKAAVGPQTAAPSTLAPTSMSFASVNKEGSVRFDHVEKS